MATTELNIHTERSTVSGLLGLRQETGADHCPEFDYGIMLAGLSLSRIPAAGTLGRDRADDSRPGTQTYSTPDDAVGLSMF
jgi:hypothetical protein